MEIRNSLEGLKSLLGVNGTAPAATESKRPATSASSLNTDHATLSNAATEVAQTALEDGVRTEKVASIQAALAAGTYSVAASAVASKMVDAMLGSGQ
jgi:negative regulator of flagellin synthesis FlgM